jgi:hypothetical protein
VLGITPRYSNNVHEAQPSRVRGTGRAVSMLRRRMPRRIQASLRTSLPGGRAHHGVAPRTGAYQGPDVSPRAPFLLARPAFISRSCQDHRDSCPPVQRLTTEIPDSVLFQRWSCHCYRPLGPPSRVHLPLRRSLSGRPPSPIPRHSLHLRQPAQV